MVIIEAFKDGGPFMFVIATFGVLTAAFVVERYLSLYSVKNIIPENYVKLLRELIGQGKVGEAERLAQQTNSPLSPVVARGCQLLRKGGFEEEISARMDEELSRAVNKIDRRTGFLSMFR